MRKSVFLLLSFFSERERMALMKKTAVTILLILLVFSLPASSLFVGIGGGRTYNRIIAGENYTGYEYLSGFGWKASLPVTVECTPNFGFETGVSLTEKTYRIFRETHGVTPVDVTETNLFVTVPVTLRVSVICSQEPDDEAAIVFFISSRALRYLVSAPVPSLSTFTSGVMPLPS